jgi:hypothetical protein
MGKRSEKERGKKRGRIKGDKGGEWRNRRTGNRRGGYREREGEEGEDCCRGGGVG